MMETDCVGRSIAGGSREFSPPTSIRPPSLLMSGHTRPVPGGPEPEDQARATSRRARLRWQHSLRAGGGNRPALPPSAAADANSRPRLACQLKGRQNGCTAFLGVTPLVTPSLEIEHRRAPITG